MNTAKISCRFKNGTTVQYEYRDLVDLLIGEDAELPPSYFLIEADAATGESVKISISCVTGAAIVTIENKS